MKLNKLEHYLSLKYSIELSEIWDEDESKFIYCARIKELPGLKVYGDSYNEVLEDIEDAKIAWFEASIKMDREIALPTAEQEEVTGRVTFRMDKTLHRKLKISADLDGVSLNQIINNLVRRGLEESSFDSLSRKVDTIYEQNNEIVRRLNTVDQTILGQTSYRVPEGGNSWEKKGSLNLSGLLFQN